MSTNSKNPNIRVRFAPSPTGYLHIGNIRAGLFNWLYARNQGGKFMLRIEDTDLERSEKKYTDDVIASMKWLGLTWDEEPIFQSSRLSVYLEKANELIASGHAYRCTCSEADVEKMREVAMAAGKKPMYDRRCRELGLNPAPGTPYVIRAKVPLTGHLEFTDLIRGTIRVENEEIDDFVLIRSNGAPTYNLSVVVDDVFSKMTHIIRGDDHINNTPKQIHLYRYLNYDIPLFAHLPMILGPDKKKLSKRHGSVSVNAYRADGFLPEAMLNFLARLGWSHGDQEVFSAQELRDFFSFEHVQKSPAVFNMEKLLWLNGAHIRQAEPQRLVSIVTTDFVEYFSGNSETLARAQSSLGARLVSLIQPKVKTLKEMTELLVPMCTPGAVEVDPKELKWNKDESLKAASKAAVVQILADLSQKVAGKISARSDTAWGASASLEEIGMNHEAVDAFLRQVGERHGVKLGDLTQPMRLVVTGRMVSVGLFDLMAILPWDLIEMRLGKIAAL